MPDINLPKSMAMSSVSARYVEWRERERESRGEALPVFKMNITPLNWPCKEVKML